MIQLWAIGGAAAVAFASGWAVNGWRLNAQHDAERVERLKTEAESARLADRARALKDAELRTIRDTSTANLDKARDENRQLRDRLDLGSFGLRVRATCPPRLPTAGAATSADVGTSAELAADARPAYHALRDGIVVTESRLRACQAELRARVE